MIIEKVKDITGKKWITYYTPETEEDIEKLKKIKGLNWGSSFGDLRKNLKKKKVKK